MITTYYICSFNVRSIKYFNLNEMRKIIQSKYPSNIALVKYWGKFGNQMPCNASLSMTLSEAVTEVELTLDYKSKKEIEFDYFFEGNKNDSFRNRILNYIENQIEFKELLDHYALTIKSNNTFPHSAGIASSASAFAAISAALLKAKGEKIDDDFNRKASRLARLGSGSACRSFYGPYAMWGELNKHKEASNEYAIPIQEVHENFKEMRDAILIVEDKPKKVSSSIGHSLMNNHSYAEKRFIDANKNCEEMLSTLKRGDYEEFIQITEREALSLHAMMMTSRDYYMLMKPGTVEIIDKVFQFREETKLPLCFTLDAGPNIHLLYPVSIQEKVHTFIAEELKDNTKSVLFDKIGAGGIVL